MKALIGSLLVLSIALVSGNAMAGGKPDGATCHVHKSCQSKLCLRENPLDKFGKCCDAQDCPSLGAQCGEIDNGCGTPIQCGECGPGSNCQNNQCVQGSTTTTNTFTTTTIFQPASCAGRCGDSSGAGGCYCDDFSCVNNDGCADRDAECPNICNPPSTTTTIPPSTTSTTSTTTTTSCFNGTCPSGVGNFEACGSTPSCYIFQTTEDACGVCANGGRDCFTPSCNTTADCPSGDVCVINSCCGTGSCLTPCAVAPTTTTTVPPTTTTLPPPTTTSTTLP